MYTNFHFTNLSIGNNNIAFFQKDRNKSLANTKKNIWVKNCQYKWSCKIRVLWDLSFRLVKACGNTTSLYNLKTVYTTINKLFLISKHGIISIQQSHKSGKQIIDFKQIKGNEFIAIQIYRGDFLIEEQYFKGKYLSFQIGTVISISKLNSKEPSLNIDFTSLKSIYLTLVANKIQLETIEKW